MHATASRITLTWSVGGDRSERTMLRRTSRGLGLVVALLVVGSVLAVIAGGPRADSQASSPSTDTTTQSAAGLGALASGARNPYTWPFSRDSIWNLPVGAGANYVAANITRATGRAMFPDPDVLILKPNSPITRVWFNKDAWNVLPGPPGRCNPEDKTGDGVPDVLFSAPIPTNFVVYGSNDTRNPHGRTPNYATAILDTDNVTLYQGQPFARCTANGNATIWWFQKNERLDGLGRSGAHGGSMLSSIGGTVRLGELGPGGVLRHAIKVELDGSANYYRIGTDNPNGSRWPATRADWCATHPPSCYGGTVSELRMGSLLALRPAFNITALETEPARILAHALQDYGGYTVDNAGWSVYTIATEFSPDGDVINEFAAKWGFPLGVAANANTNWSRDLHAIFGALHVIKNWNASVWSTVSASNGTQGAGSGAPRVPWAPPFGQAPAKVIGTTTAYNSTLPVYADNKWGNRYTLSEQGSFTKISGYLDGRGPGSGGEVLRALIYADSGGTPGALRAASATVTIADGQAARWVDFSISPAVTLQPGDYWLVLQAGAVSQAALRDGVAQNGVEKWDPGAFSDRAADPFWTPN